MGGLQVVILAAGQGKRMRSNMPKVLHKLAGKSLLEHVVTTALELKPTQPPLVIYGHQGDILRQQSEHLDVSWVEQTNQLGTGHALQQALPQLAKDTSVLILYGDVPLITAATLKQLISTTPPQAIGMITANALNPTGYGRILRDRQNKMIDIIEEKDADDAQRTIQEINTGIYLIPAPYLQKWLPQLKNNNTQKEYYLTDVVRLAVTEKIEIHSIYPQSYEETLGVNDRWQLANLERIYQRKQAELLMEQGVTLIDPDRFDLRGEINAGKDITIDINVILEGKVILGNQCSIGPNCIIRNAIIGDKVIIRANSIIEDAEIGNESIIGPFARLRPETVLAEKTHIGNFVEIKKSSIGRGTKINHLSYIGDSEIGKEVNIGAGTITCNYDGVAKHRTLIGDKAFIGSCVQLVAPVTIGEEATIGAGSTITRNAPPGQLTLSRAKQLTIENWQRPKQEES